MRQIEWIDGGKYNLEDSKKFIEFMQMKHPFCEKIDNQDYMESVRFTYSELYGVDEKLIDVSSEEAFVSSFDKIGLARIF